MAGINQGTPEAAVGEPIRLGSNNEFEIEHHPVSDRLIIRDTENGKVAYVRKERGGEIGGDGVLIKALKEGKPMADDGRTHETIQEAERAASGWLFVPPGTFNESVHIETDNITIRGSGYNTIIDGGGIGTCLIGNADNTTVENLRLQTTVGSGNGHHASTGLTNIYNVSVSGTSGEGFRDTEKNIINCRLKDIGDRAGYVRSEGIISGCHLLDCESGFIVAGGGAIIANNVVINPNDNGFRLGSDPNTIIIGNRVHNAGQEGIHVSSADNEDIILANNRISDSTDEDILDQGVNTLLDGNLTGASN